MGREEHELAILVTAKNLAGKTLSGVKGQIGGIERQASKGFRNASHNIERFAAAAVGSAAAIGLASLKLAADFESGMNTINTVIKVTPGRLEEIGTAIRSTAVKSGQSLDDLQAAYYDLVSAGVDAADAQSVLNDAVTLGIGGLATTSETVDLLTTAMNAYGLTAEGVTQATDMFAESIALGKVKASDIAASFATVAPIAKSFGIGIDEIAAAYGHMTARGVPANEVATQMRSAIKELLKPNKDLIKLQEKSGINFAKMAKNKGLVVALQTMRKEAEKAGIPFQDLFGRIEGFNFALSTTGENADAYAAALNKVQNSTGEANAQMAERAKGLNFNLDRLRELARDAGITIGQELLPMVTDLAQKLVDFASSPEGVQAIKDIARAVKSTLTPIIDRLSDFLSNPPNLSGITNVGERMGEFISDALDFAEAFPWEQVKEGMKLAAAGAKAAVDLFKSLPPWVQTAVITGWGLNKLTGGALSGIIGELGKGIIKGVLGMTAAVVNLKAGTVTGVGAGGGKGGTGVVGGGASKLIQAVSIVSIAASALAVFEAWKDYQATVDAGLADVDSKLGQYLATNPTRSQLAEQLATLKRVPDTLDPIKRTLFEMNVSGVKTKWEEGIEALEKEIAATKGVESAVDSSATETGKDSRRNATSTNRELQRARAAVQAAERKSSQDVARLTTRTVSASNAVSRNIDQLDANEAGRMARLRGAVLARPPIVVKNDIRLTSVFRVSGRTIAEELTRLHLAKGSPTNYRERL